MAHSNGEGMRAVRFHEYGPASVLVVEELSRPQPKEGEVLVQVHAAGVNPFDWKLRAGHMQEWMPLELPSTPGLDVAGTVMAVGPGVTEFRVGQPVFGRGTGTYAEYAIAPVGALAVKPEALSFDQAATLTIAGVTSWVGIFDDAGLHAGQSILIHGGAGGVGSIAVQLAHWKGAHVTATASAGNSEFVSSLGADEVIDYNQAPFENTVREIDVVFDSVGGELADRSLTVLKKGGVLVSIAGMPPVEAAGQRGVRATFVQAPAEIAPILREIAKLVDAGDIKANVGEVFPLQAAAQAHARSETGHGRGRIVLHVTD